MIKLTPRQVRIRDTWWTLPDESLDSGGEGVIYPWGDNEVLKIFIEPHDHPQAVDPSRRQTIARRYSEYADKLQALPAQLPRAVIRPLALAYNENGQVVGYTMRRVRGLLLQEFVKKSIRKQQGLNRQDIVTLLLRLHDLVQAVHNSGMVIGDFTDNNVLVDEYGYPYLIDVDSMQFGSYRCYGFTERFVDPLKYPPGSNEPLIRSTQLSDWFAFTIMAFEQLTHAHPYFAGTHEPTNGGPELKNLGRTRARVSLFSTEVVYPVSALPLTALPDAILDFFQAAFEQDRRQPFPRSLLEEMHWTTCRRCQKEHACAVCPHCSLQTDLVDRMVRQSGMPVRLVFSTAGRILASVMQAGSLHYAYQTKGNLQREDGRVLQRHPLPAGARVYIQGETTIVAHGQAAQVFRADGSIVDRNEGGTRKSIPCTANSDAYYWVTGSNLYSDRGLGPVKIGQVPDGELTIEAGEQFGVGVSFNNGSVGAFVFDARKPSITALPHQVQVGKRGSVLLDISVTFGTNLAWVFIGFVEDQQIKHHCLVIERDATLAVHEFSLVNDGNWLGHSTISPAATGRRLFATSPHGIVRIGLQNNRTTIEATFPRTLPLITSATQLVLSDAGIFLVTHQEILLAP